MNIWLDETGSSLTNFLLLSYKLGRCHNSLPMAWSSLESWRSSGKGVKPTELGCGMATDVWGKVLRPIYSICSSGPRAYPRITGGPSACAGRAAAPGNSPQLMIVGSLYVKSPSKVACVDNFEACVLQHFLEFPHGIM